MEHPTLRQRQALETSQTTATIATRTTAAHTTRIPSSLHPKSHRAHSIVVISEILCILLGSCVFNLCEDGFVYDINNFLLSENGFEFYKNCQNFTNLCNGQTLYFTNDAAPELHLAIHRTPCLVLELPQIHVVNSIFYNDELNHNVLNNALPFGM